METVKCYKCGRVCKPNGIVGGYAVERDGNRYCFKCAAKREAQVLRELAVGESIHLYLVVRNGEWCVQNFTGLLSIPIYYIKAGRHNFAGIRHDFWVEYHDNIYHGVVYGEDTQLARVKRIKGNAGGK